MNNNRVASALLRGAVGSLVASIVIVGILLLPDTGSTLTERLILDQSEIIALGAVIAAAFIAGVINALMDARIMWLVIGVAILPVHFMGFWLICGFGESAWCKTTAGSICLGTGLLVAFSILSLIFGSKYFRK